MSVGNSPKDICERLRNKLERVHDLSGAGYAPDPLHEEAAAEIERLRVNLEIARQDARTLQRDAAIQARHDALEAAAAVADSEMEITGEPSFSELQELERCDVVSVARGSTRATAKNIAERIRALKEK